MVKNLIFYIILSFLLAFASDSVAQGDSRTRAYAKDVTKKLEDYLASAHAAYRFNGTALVALKGEILLQKGYGWSNVHTKALNKADTRFPILSITKSFTAITILKLQEDGKLSVKDPLTKYFPDYPNGDKIKIHHLLTHSSGIYNYTEPLHV